MKKIARISEEPAGKRGAQHPMRDRRMERSFR
jgi:hypothetical protein